MNTILKCVIPNAPTTFNLLSTVSSSMLLMFRENLLLEIMSTDLKNKKIPMRYLQCSERIKKKENNISLKLVQQI